MSVIFFAFGQQQKSSLISQFCRENNYQHLKNPNIQNLKNYDFKQSIILQGTLQLFNSLQPIYKEMKVIFVGKNFSQEENKIREDYRKIGKCHQITDINNYPLFRKSLYPNLIFFYGPNQYQIQSISSSISNLINYKKIKLPANSNSFIKQLSKKQNYIINGLFTDKNQINILEEYFNLKIIHLQYNRTELGAQKAQFFDKQFEILSYLKNKKYYYGIKGNLYQSSASIFDKVCTKLSPQLIYVSSQTAQKRQYVNNYVNSNQSILILSILQIQSINKRKNIALAQSPINKLNLLNQIIYKNFNITQVIIIDYPYILSEILQFQNLNQKFKMYVDLLDQRNFAFSKDYNLQMYFLETQKRIKVLDLEKPLEQYVKGQIQYWIVNGTSGAGKTTVAKQLANQFGFKLIQYEPYMGAIKQKLITPEDGQQLPLRKILQHFKSLLQQNSNTTYVIDGLSFQNKDLQEWIKVVGPPSVINLEVPQNQSIKRTRKKNEADVNAQINEQELNKAKQSTAKSQRWLDKVKQACGSVKIYELDFNSPLIICQKRVQQIFKKNVYLVQDHNSYIFQNIALKYNLGFVNLHSVPLRETLQFIRKIPQKDVIICYYRQNQQKMISQDLYWIEKNIGTIKYLAIWQPEQVEIKEEIMELKKPEPAQKPKVQGGQGQQKPAEQQPADKKKSFDIYSYEWTKPINPKNLSQWFLKSKKNISKVESSNGKQVFNNWKDLISDLQKSNDSAIYHTFK